VSMLAGSIETQVHVASWRRVYERSPWHAPATLDSAANARDDVLC
jgi:hypothetical protein